MSEGNRRDFMRFVSLGAITTALNTNIAKALAIPANNATGSINDVEHIVILMQENRPFDHHFGTLSGVRGFSDPRAVNISLPLQSGAGIAQVPVFLQPAGPRNLAQGWGVSPVAFGGPADGAYVIPPFRVNPESVSPGLESLGLTYFPGTDHDWETTQFAWDEGRFNMWAIQKGPIAMSYMTRADIPYHFALADAFTVGDAYHSSIMGPTDPNRMYLWTGCVGNVDYLGSGGTDGLGAGPVTYNGLSVNHAYYVWQTFPEVLQAAGVSWKIYQDLAGLTFAPEFGEGHNPFAGNYGDNSMLYFQQYRSASPGSALFENACTGTRIINSIPSDSAPPEAWLAWQETLFDQFQSDVQSGNLPQVSWIVGPAGYTEHPDYPIDYGAWYISQIFDILVSNPDVFSKTIFLINYDEADGSFDHVVPPTPPPSSTYGASTVSIENEVITDATPNGPAGLNTRVPLLAISPWSKGGYVVSQVFDHTSVIQFLEKRFGVYEQNLSPWRRAVAGDLTSAFNFANPNDAPVTLPPTASYLPPTSELAGGSATVFKPTQSDVILGVPVQEPGVRPARALPYTMDVQAAVNASNRAVMLTFLNTGTAAVVFQVRSGNPGDMVRTYTVGPGLTLADTWNAVSSYALFVYGPNGFVRYFNGAFGPGAAALVISAGYGTDSGGSIALTITNAAAVAANVSALDAYTGNVTTSILQHEQTFIYQAPLAAFSGWYDLILTVAGDPAFKYEAAGHVETGQDSTSDPAMGGLVTLKTDVKLG